jgi:hypothetical protein
MNNNTRTIWGIIILIVLAIALIVWSKKNSPSHELVTTWESVGVSCLPNGHQNLGQHIHSDLKILMNDTEVTIPANVGVVSTCMAEVHTHDTTGKIHIETAAKSDTFTLGQFFGVWGESLEKDGYDVTFKVNGATTTDPKNYVIRDEQTLELFYALKK